MQRMNHFYKDSIIFVYHILVFVCFHFITSRQRVKLRKISCCLLFVCYTFGLQLSCFCCINNLIVSSSETYICVLSNLLFFSNFAHWLRKLDLCENYYIYTVLNESEHITYTVLNIRFFIFPYINHVGINDEINW